MPRKEDISRLPLESGIILEAPILRAPSKIKYRARKFPINPEPAKAKADSIDRSKFGKDIKRARDEKTIKFIKTVAITPSIESPVAVAFLIKNVVKAKKNAAIRVKDIPSRSIDIVIFPTLFVN
ncbi:hypothetical protein AKJ56_00220 [candidate division MSBL1 archaeon SCGC-AAA382N08]|uniref:Uncharacterized protein n=1 Tax=candidate division MSBL1 archaeon SCGC-AAA382N08 TaxID=1698285 RepID=A0A133VQS6_9EURY|nr:hypothetical protein AKJ56_00220 [candidate division MSBL1 archaeon SCGC-AAA382N08]